MQDQKISSWSQTQNNGPLMRAFKVGVDSLPWWFIDKLKDGTVEAITKGKGTVGYRYYDTKGRERSIYSGGIVYIDSLYDYEPKRK